MSLPAQRNEPKYMIENVSWQETDFIQTMSFELVVELLLGKGHRLAVYDALAGIDQFVGDLFAVQS